MKKKQLFLAATAILLASCTDTTYLGDQAAITNGSGVISFGSSSPAVTRAESYGSEAAAKLEYKFRVFGVKTMGTGTSPTDQRVFATNATGVYPYDVWFVNGSSNSTASNSSNWEYVGANGQTYGTTGHTVTLTADQTIKYWDYSATAYNFQAWSDINAADSKVNVSAIDKNTMTIKGTPTQLANFWISDLQTGAPASFTSKVVQFTFRKAATKVRLGIYEIVPGYQVNNVKFYYTDDTEKSSTSNAILDGKFVGTSSSSETFNVTYDATTHRAVIEPSDATTSNKTFFDFGEFTTGTTAVLGETSTSPTWANSAVSDHYISVMPNTASGNIDNMTLKIDYTLYNSVSGESIEIKGATAIVPAAYMTWKPNYAYTYLFKITDDKLNPITLDAVVIDDGEGKQETITTVTNPSITTYQNGSDVTTKNEYNAGDIYVVVGNGTVLTVGTDAKLYTATADAGYPGGITEASVANAIANGKPVFDAGTKLDANTSLDGYYTKDGTTYTACAATEVADGNTTYYKPTGALALTDTNNKTITITPADGLTAFDKILAADSPTGADLTVNGAKFTATASTTYAFEYRTAAAVNYTAEEANTHNAGLTGAVSTSVAYSFTSWADAECTTTQHGTGMVKFISSDATYTTVEVISNTPIDANAPSFVGNKYRVKATSLSTNASYQLYETTSETSLPIYVKVAESTQDEVNAYNATLPGAISTSDVKTPAEYQYKVIKVQ